MSILRALIVVWLMSAKPLHGCQEKWKPDLRKDFLEHHKICIIILWNWNERLFDAILRSYLLIPWHWRNDGNVWFLITKGSISLNSDCHLVDNIIIILGRYHSNATCNLLQYYAVSIPIWYRLWHILNINDIPWLV